MESSAFSSFLNLYEDELLTSIKESGERGEEKLKHLTRAGMNM